MKNYYKVYNVNGLHFTTEASNDDEFWDHIAKLGIMGSYSHIVRVDRARGFRKSAPYKTIWERKSCDKLI